AYLQQSVNEPLARSASLYALARALPTSQQSAAMALVEEGLAAFPESTELVVAKADLLLQSGQAEEAEALLQGVYDQNPANSSVGNLLAVAKARRGDIAGASAIFEAQRGSGPLVDRNLAELYVAAGRAGAALELLEPLLADDPDNAQLQALYGTALTRTGRLAEGEEALRRALELDESNALARRSLSLLEQQRSLTGDAEIQFSEEAGVAFQQGLYALNANDYGAAAKAFARSREVDENPLAAFYHGYAKQLSGDTRGALADYEVALEAFPDSDIVLNNIGYAHLQLGRYDLALQNIRRAVEANPDNAQARLNLGLVHYALRQYEQAITELEAAVELDADLAGTVEDLIAAARQALGQ
ncbi:MAG TPA: tetratricopeptide repeat protein, partial [Trueperaceae bacterium]|nr:tetratricopeptide repeat protein [Trueperaceae bacterium]